MFEGSPVDKGRFQQLVGQPNLTYLSHTKPNIAFAISLVSQYMHDRCQGHLNAIYKILRYRKQTPGKGLFFKKKTKRKVGVFTDADWVGSVDDRKSTSGYCTIISRKVVTWKSKKQTVVARSSVEAKCRAMAHGVCKSIWIKRLLGELKIEYEAPISSSMIISLRSVLHITLYIMTELNTLKWTIKLMEKLSTSNMYKQINSWLILSQKGYPNESLIF
ncbi:secreted RxLR effector protein 161-like [Humulus lupulus]|uniref:secreted RxLR effector protein 161-like n=1 Tax=Humulus lupulus TaxID=3486 RepID=UPI002B417E3D|nr:secreted RxLR effector protein 161-like [Humulus lupulus]